MAYSHATDSGHYIYGGEDYVYLDYTMVSDDAVAVFLYELYNDSWGDDDFWQRYYHGKQVIDNFSKGFYIQKLSAFSDCFDDFDEQAAAISALAGVIWRECYTPILGAAQVEYMLEKYQSAQQTYIDIEEKNYICFTAKDAETRRLIGYCAVIPEKGSFRLSKLYVLKDFRGKGVAYGFLEKMMSIYKDHYGLSKIRLDVNKKNGGAITAFKKIGFEIVGSVKNDIGGGFFMDDYMMELEFKDADKKTTNNYDNEELTEARLTLEYALLKFRKKSGSIGKFQRMRHKHRIKALEIALSLIDLKMGSSSPVQKPAD
jgi:RimJ/RimL family protein N-acetyltransferase